MLATGSGSRVIKRFTTHASRDYHVTGQIIGAIVGFACRKGDGFRRYVSRQLQNFQRVVCGIDTC